jgi:hypothetical protein
MDLDAGSFKVVRIAVVSVDDDMLFFREIRMIVSNEVSNDFYLEYVGW